MIILIFILFHGWIQNLQNLQILMAQWGHHCRFRDLNSGLLLTESPPQSWLLHLNLFIVYQLLLGVPLPHLLHDTWWFIWLDPCHTMEETWAPASGIQTSLLFWRPVQWGQHKVTPSSWGIWTYPWGYTSLCIRLYFIGWRFDCA